MTARHELIGICLEGKSRLQLAEAKPIEQDDVIEILRKLNDAQAKIDDRMEKKIADAKYAAVDTEWDQSSHAVFVVPTFQMAHSPKAIADFALAAINNGAKSADLVYKMIVAEMDAAVARYMVTMNAGMAQTGVVGDALLATTGASRLSLSLQNFSASENLLANRVENGSLSQKVKKQVAGGAQTSVTAFLQRLQADTAVADAPLDWSRMSKEIHAEHDRVITTLDRETLLGVHKTVMDHVEQQIRPENLEEFRKFRSQDYNQLLIKEAMIGNDDILDTHVMAVITNREVAAGRMRPDDELHKLAAAGSFIFGSRPKPYTLSDFSFKSLFGRLKGKAQMSNKRCMYIIQKKGPGPVKPDECCEKSAVEQEADTGRWYCREHLDKRRSGDAPAKSNGDGHTFSFQT